jgi:EAL and modified HD-GYP domain-containing signal transduction protein
MADVFIGRQPVLDAKQRVWGYELLFRSSAENRASFSDAQAATSQVILNALVEFGLQQVIGTGRGLVNLPREFLLSDHTDLLPPSQIVLEILEDVEIDDELIAGVKRLRDLGYSIALDDYTFEPRWAPLIELADIIKVEVPAISPDELQNLGERINELKIRGITLLAEKVETKEEFDAYRKLGFDLFQGYFFSKPNVIQGSRIPGSRMQVLRLVAELNKEDPDLSDLEVHIAANVDLSYKIMRLLNSARYSLPRQIDSIKQAVVMLGTQQLRTLATMVAISGIDDKPSELVMMSLVRGRMCELLASRERSAAASSAFTVGMLSTLDALLDRPLEEVLGELPLVDEVRSALLEREGLLGQYLNWAIGCETADWSVVDSIAIDTGELATLYIDSMEWARNTLSDVND